jgi:hypothetical protein
LHSSGDFERRRFSQTNHRAGRSIASFIPRLEKTAFAQAGRNATFTASGAPKHSATVDAFDVARLALYKGIPQGILASLPN